MKKSLILTAATTALLLTSCGALEIKPSEYVALLNKLPEVQYKTATIEASFEETGERAKNFKYTFNFDEDNLEWVSTSTDDEAYFLVEYIRPASFDYAYYIELGKPEGYKFYDDLSIVMNYKDSSNFKDGSHEDYEQTITTRFNANGYLTHYEDIRHTSSSGNANPKDNFDYDEKEIVNISYVK